MTNRLLIGFGSHTGQAESISKALAERARTVGLEPEVRTLNDIEKELDLTNESFIVIVVSSTGDGDAPENSARFLRRISRKTLKEDHLKGLTYALLGLGDSNYSTYQGVPIKMDHQLSFLGATRVLERGEADDQVGLELIVEPWIDKLFNEELKSRFSLEKSRLVAAFSSKITLGETKTAEEKEKIMEEWKARAKSEESVEGETTVFLSSSERVALSLVDFDYPAGASVRSGADKISSDPNLRVPIAPQSYIKGTLGRSIFRGGDDLPWQNDAPMPGVISTKPLSAVVVSHSILTSLHQSVTKPKRELIFELADVDLAYEPGDAFYITPQNSEAEVNFLLDRLGHLSTADNEYELSIDPASSKACAALPNYLPVKSSLRHLFTYCLDIRRAPGRPLLRFLADSASDSSEKRRLLELCSAQGVAEFTAFVRQAALSLADVLLAFPSTLPKVERLIENLPRLMPRPYSMSSCVAAHGRRLRFAYSIREDAAREGRRYSRVGVQTGVLTDLRIGQRVKLLEKESARFRLPPLNCAPEVGLYTPLVLIGPGTGVSTFLSFTQHIRMHLKKQPEDKECRETKRILYFGCRDKNKDFIYKDEIETLQEMGVLSTVHLAQSTVEGEPKYVQDAIRTNAVELFSLLRDSSSSAYPARVYVCGDAKGMSKDLWECFVQCAAETGGCSIDEARKYMMELKKADRYIEDVWS
ncbi:hypothetical protein PMAYCL1PPCAC_07318 [Pristionchus mayeri]|uniref:Methionine synthase reductase n=1 Tax=Pristionchus mayeri TaxID=1317129 RepID=A0AAN4ZEM3_9BILA|nr:hypothetical protein PMAYCL1PPCAC_07318 [Pristionchus mayeri]